MTKRCIARRIQLLLECVNKNEQYLVHFDIMLSFIPKARTTIKQSISRVMCCSISVTIFYFTYQLSIWWRLLLENLVDLLRSPPGIDISLSANNGKREYQHQPVGCDVLGQMQSMMLSFRI